MDSAFSRWLKATFHESRDILCGDAFAQKGAMVSTVPRSDRMLRSTCRCDSHNWQPVNWLVEAQHPVASLAALY